MIALGGNIEFPILFLSFGCLGARPQLGFPIISKHALKVETLKGWLAKEIAPKKVIV